MATEGECFCGAIRYSISGPLCDARSCHCSRCRKAFSSQVSAYAELDPQQFQWKRGEDLLTLYQNQHGFGLQFCKICGSTLCGTYNGEIHGVTLGCINGDPGIEIGRHIFVGSKAKWEVMPEGVIQYDEAVPDDTKQSDQSGAAATHMSCERLRQVTRIPCVADRHIIQIVMKMTWIFCCLPGKETTVGKRSSQE